MDDTPPEMPANRSDNASWPGWAAATAICIRFYSRLPVPPLPGERGLHAAPDFRQVPRALPFAALVIALPAALVLLVTGAAGTAPLLAAGLALAALVLTTGALHEDGFADSADGLFGGRDAEQRLAIMRDSRIGSYGTLAIVLSLLLRASALAAILDAAGGLATAAVVMMAAAWSRLEGLYLMAEEPPARSDGAAASVGRPSGATAWIACGLSLAIAFGLTVATSLPVAGLTLGLALAHAGTLFLARLSRRLIGGQTGDIIGAAQQLAEIALYVGFAFVLGAG
jgi:adenosylcobinamide-GDP ribazoletransferase